jgi:dsRNA-specific ribonuclease
MGMPTFSGSSPGPGSSDAQKSDFGNFKSALNEIVMKVQKQPLKNGDIIYSSSLMTMAEGIPKYNASVRIAVLDGREFDGEPQLLRKDAEQSAAKAALNHLSTPSGQIPGVQKMPSVMARSQEPKLPNYKGRLQELLVQDQMKSRIFGVANPAGAPVDISYSTVIRPPDTARAVGAEFSATIRISALGKQVEFTGEISRERKTAEQSAAQKALQHFLEQENLTNATPLQTAQVSRAMAPKSSAKSELNELVMKILARPSTPQDIVYEVRHRTPFKIVVSVPSLQVDRKFEGKEFPIKKQAEQSAAQEVLNYFRSLPSMPRPAPGAADAGAATLARRAAPVAPVVGTTDTNSAAMDAKGVNHKSALNEFVMKLAGRPLTTGDITYAVKSMRPGQYQATAKIPVIDDMEFAAAPRSRKRDAEQCAAQIALLYYQAKYPSGGVPMADDGDGAKVTVSRNFKSLLNELAMRTAGRPLQDGDILYVVRAVGAGQFQATVKPLVVDPSFEFQGEVCARKKEAEQKAASKALDAFQKNPPAPRSQPAPAQSSVPNSTLAHGMQGNSSIDASLASRTLASTDVGNYKSALNELVMRSGGRPLDRNDILYLSKPVGNGSFLTTVKVPQLDPVREFEGEPKPRKRDAEQMAAKAALQYFQSGGAPPRPDMLSASSAAPAIQGPH